MNIDIVYKRLQNEDGILLYEGDTLFDKPYGKGKTYFSNGNLYQEGEFGIKGLIIGKEYYPSGSIRFEGEFTICKAYGPNYPRNGRCFDENGNLYYEGDISCTFGGVGYPSVIIPEEYGPITQDHRPDISYFMWEDEERFKNNMK